METWRDIMYKWSVPMMYISRLNQSYYMDILVYIKENGSSSFSTMTREESIWKWEHGTWKGFSE